MSDEDCVSFLQSVLPRLRMRWPGFRKVRRQVCRRIDRRLRELGLSDFDAYRSYLERHGDEWGRLDAFCRISISRFYRDRDVFDAIGNEVLPTLAREAERAGTNRISCWSAGCASGEEPYSLVLVWYFEVAPRFPHIQLDVTATDADLDLLDRAQLACYPPSSVKLLPETWLREAFERSDSSYALRTRFRGNVELRHQDLREKVPASSFSLILCRNLAFTYFSEGLQEEILDALVSKLLPGGVLVIGRRESLPRDQTDLAPWNGNAPGIYRLTT